MKLNDTIVAQSTPQGKGAIGIIRLSGKDSIKIVNSLFPSKDLSKVKSHTIHYGNIQYEKSIIDEVLISVFKKPNSYTRENIIEISVPVNYSINYDMFLDFFEHFSYEITDNNNGTTTIEVNNNIFNLSENFIEYCSLMKYQMVPVLFFTDNSDDIKHIHVDSWNNYTLRNISDDISISYSYNFMPMFSITPGSDHLYFNFDLGSSENTYNFSFPKRDMENYSKLFVKFFRANDLETNLISYSTNR